MTLTSATDEKTYDGTALTNKDVTFTAGCASKRYDGTPLTNNTARVSSGSIADIQTWTVSVSQTAVGTGRNVAADAVRNYPDPNSHEQEAEGRKFLILR